MKITITNTGRIKNANIDVADFTILVSKNSTNKGYTAHIIYVLNKILGELDSPLNNRLRQLEGADLNVS